MDRLLIDNFFDSYCSFVEDEERKRRCVCVTSDWKTSFYASENEEGGDIRPMELNSYEGERNNRIMSEMNNPL